MTLWQWSCQSSCQLITAQSYNCGVLRRFQTVSFFLIKEKKSKLLNRAFFLQIIHPLMIINAQVLLAILKKKKLLLFTKKDTFEGQLPWTSWFFGVFLKCSCCFLFYVGEYIFQQMSLFFCIVNYEQTEVCNLRKIKFVMQKIL